MAGGAWFLRRAVRRRRLPIVDVGVRCPESDCAAVVAGRTDPAAWTGGQYVDVVRCPLASEAAVTLPARTGYLFDAPTLPVLLEPAPDVPSPALEVTSGATDAMDLVRQAERRPRITRLLWYGGA